jgi:hypothetical protein
MLLITPTNKLVEEHYIFMVVVVVVKSSTRIRGWSRGKFWTFS